MEDASCQKISNLWELILMSCIVQQIYRILVNYSMVSTTICLGKKFVVSTVRISQSFEKCFLIHFCSSSFRNFRLTTEKNNYSAFWIKTWSRFQLKNSFSWWQKFWIRWFILIENVIHAICHPSNPLLHRYVAFAKWAQNNCASHLQSKICSFHFRLNLCALHIASLRISFFGKKIDSVIKIGNRKLSKWKFNEINNDSKC